VKNTRLLVPSINLPVADLDPFLRLAERGVGGFCVFGDDRLLPEVLPRLREAAPHPLLIAADWEDGRGRYPPAAALDPDAAEAAGVMTAVEARALGITMTFAPVCDVVSHERNPIIQARAFRDAVAAVPRFIAGARRFGLRTCAKHFPGHGATDSDSHDALPTVLAPVDTWRARDFPPFAAAIEAGVDAVMTAHIACPALTGDDTAPATLSRRVMTDLLRGEFGFDGLLVTDALVMDGVLQGRTEGEAARLAMAAGCDVILCPKDIEGVLSAMEGLRPAEVSLERLARVAEPLPDALVGAAAASVTAEGPLPVGPGPHPLRICDLTGDGRELAKAAGVAFELYDREAKLVGKGGGTGLEVPSLAILRKDMAWAGPLEIAASVRSLAGGIGLLILLGPDVLGRDIDAPARVRAPGQDSRTLAAVARRAFGLNCVGRSS